MSAATTTTIQTPRRRQQQQHQRGASNTQQRHNYIHHHQDAAVLVTPPRCSNGDDDDDAMHVEIDRYETVDVSNNAATGGGASTTTTTSSNPLIRFFVGGGSGNENQGSRRQASATTSKSNKSRRNTAKMRSNRHRNDEDDDFYDMKEMEDRTTLDVGGGFDTCREYSYPEEDDNEEDDDMYDDDYDPSASWASTPSLMDGNYSSKTILPNDSATTSLGRRGEDTNASIGAGAASPQDAAVRTHVVGRTYHPILDYASKRDDESSLFWFTYRCDFQEMVPYEITSDAGWGCTLRSAQMMLAQALRLHYKTRSWRPSASLSKRRHDPFMRSLLTWFADYPSTTSCVYSIHNMVAAGLKYEKLPGEWYGPGSACHVLRDLVDLHGRIQERRNGTANKKLFRVHVASQGTVYRDDVEKLMTRDSAAAEARAQVVEEDDSRPGPAHPLDWEVEFIDPSTEQEKTPLPDWDTSLLLLIPLRLGLKSFHADYVRSVANTFSFPQSVGVIGGRPRGARWFYGAVEDGSKILGLDPHTVQKAPRRRRNAFVNGRPSPDGVVDLSDDYLRSVHTTYSEAFSLQKMDPSIAVGFYCRDRDDLRDLLSNLESWNRGNPTLPDLFSVEDAVPDYDGAAAAATADMMSSSMTNATLDNGHGIMIGSCDDDLNHDDDDNSDEDEYVML